MTDNRNIVYGALLARIRYAAHEARQLLRRKKLSYALFATALTVGSLYAASFRPVAVTNGATPNKSRPLTVTPQQSQTTTNSQNSSGANESDDTQQSNTTSQHSETSVTVNGQDIAVPHNGHTHTVIKSQDNTTSVDVTHSSSSDSSSSSSLSIQVNSSVSSSSSDGDT